MSNSICDDSDGADDDECGDDDYDDDDDEEEEDGLPIGSWVPPPTSQALWHATLPRGSNSSTSCCGRNGK